MENEWYIFKSGLGFYCLVHLTPKCDKWSTSYPKNSYPKNDCSFCGKLIPDAIKIQLQILNEK